MDPEPCKTHADLYQPLKGAILLLEVGTAQKCTKIANPWVLAEEEVPFPSSYLGLEMIIPFLAC